MSRATTSRTEMPREKVVVFSGAGVSAESGLRTFRDMGGLWEQYPIEEVATPEAWAANPAKVLRFYNERRRGVLDAKPNAAHHAIAALEQRYEVVVITQNIDDLHERAGSSQVLHVHGEILKARSCVDENLIVDLTKPTIELGERCPKGSQLRPHVVWFGESVLLMEESARHFASADKILVVGTSLSVYPAAGLVEEASAAAAKYLVALEIDSLPRGYRFIQGRASEAVPRLVEGWL